MIITLTGSNNYLIRHTLDSLIDQFISKFGIHAVERVDGEHLEPIRLAELLQGASLFAPERLVVVREASTNKLLWEALANWLERVPTETTLVLAESAPDKRTKTYKLLAKMSDLRELGDLQESALAKWLQQYTASLDGSIDLQSAHYLVQQVGLDQWRLSQEIQKLVHYNRAISKESIDVLVEATPQANVFELLDAALGRQPTLVRHLLHKHSAIEDPYKLFGLLVSQIQALVIVKHAEGRAPDTIARETGLHPFVVRKTQTLARVIDKNELNVMINAIATCDTHLKSTGADPWLLLEQCLSKLATR